MIRTGEQIERLASLLRDVKRSGGKDRWSHLHSHGHKWATVKSAVLRGYLSEPQYCHYVLTDDAAAFFVWYDLCKQVKDA